jgi:hypothetical protein
VLVDVSVVILLIEYSVVIVVDSVWIIEVVCIWLFVIDDELLIVFDGAIDIDDEDECVLLIVELATPDNDIMGVSVLLLDRVGLDETVLV